jgi:hypothetical protein
LSGTGISSFDNTTSPAPLEGTYSLYDNATTGTYEIRSPAIDNTKAEYWGYGIFRMGSLAVNNWATPPIYSLRRASSDIVYFGIAETGGNGTYRWFTSCGGSQVNAGTTIVPAINTTYYFWWYYKPGTGANAVCSFWVSTTTTKPGTENATQSTGTNTTTPDQLMLPSYSSGGFNTVVHDKIRVDDEVIGSDPQ